MSEAAGRYGIEALVLALLALTAAAVTFQDRLLTRTITFSPASHPIPAVYTDQDMAGDSEVAIDKADPLAWRCALRRKFAYPYCGYELLTDPVRSTRGIDLSRFDTVTLRLRFDGPSDGLSFYLKNYDPRYSSPGRNVTNKFNRIDFRGISGRSEVILRLGDSRIPDWWMAAHPLPPRLSGPQFDNIVSFAIQTGDG